MVCDMLLTGFDAPVEQVMYLDGSCRVHRLLQAIARVNRVHAGKRRGYIVDYIGIANHLGQALQIYAGDDEAIQDVMQTMTDINGEIPVLEGRYRRIVQFFERPGCDGDRRLPAADDRRNRLHLRGAGAGRRRAGRRAPGAPPSSTRCSTSSCTA